jgi:hypothetical protein
MTTKTKRTPGPLAQANDRQRRSEAMQRFIGNMMLAQAHLNKLRDDAATLAWKDDDNCFGDSKASFDAAEVALPGGLTKLNQAVERMNADLGKWIGEQR